MAKDQKPSKTKELAKCKECGGAFGSTKNSKCKACKDAVRLAPLTRLGHYEHVRTLSRRGTEIIGRPVLVAPIILHGAPTPMDKEYDDDE